MSRFILSAALMLVSGHAMAADLRPMEPHQVRIGDRDAVVLYTDTPAGYNVMVTFAAASPDDGTSMRSSATLLPGQQTELSLGGSVGQAPSRLLIRRDADALIVVVPPLRTAAIQ